MFILNNKVSNKASSKLEIKFMSKIPYGHTSITPYIIFDDAMAAIELYKKAFDAKVIFSMPTSDRNIKTC